MDGTLAITGDGNPATDHACGMCHRGIAREGICTVCFNIGIVPYFGIPVPVRGEMAGYVQTILDEMDTDRDTSSLIGHVFRCLQMSRAVDVIDHIGWCNHMLENATCPGCGKIRGGDARCRACKSIPESPWYVATSAQYADLCSVLNDARDHNLRPKSILKLGNVLDFLNEMYVVDTECPEHVPERQTVLVRSYRSWR